MSEEIFPIIDDTPLDPPVVENIVEPETVYLNFTSGVGNLVQDASQEGEDILEGNIYVPEESGEVHDITYIEEELEALKQSLDQNQTNLGDAYISLAESKNDVAQAMEDVEVALTEANQAQEDASVALSNAQAAKDDALAAHNAAMESQELAALADGRYTVALLDPTPTDGLGKPEGAVWEVRDGGMAMRRFVLTGGSWTQIAITSEFIADLAVGTAKIADLAVTNSKINSLNVDKLVVEGGANISSAVIGNLMAQNAFLDNLYAQSIVVGSMENPVMNSGFETGTFQGWTTVGMWQIGSDAAEGTNGASCIPAAAEVVNLNSNYWDVTKDEEWLVTAWFKNSIAGAGGVVEFGFKSAAGNFVTPVPVSVGTWTQYSFSYTVPAGTTKLSAWVNAKGGSGTGSVMVDSIRAGRKLGATLIKDGSVTTDKIAADAITSDKILAGEIKTANLAAGAVDASKINVDSLAASSAFFDKAKANQLIVSADNLLPDPGFTRPECWANASYIASSGGMNGGKSLLVPASTTQIGTYSWEGVGAPELCARGHAGEIVALSAWYKCPVATAANQVSIYVKFFNESGVRVGGITNVTNNGGSLGGPANTWIKLKGNSPNIPEGATRVSIGLFTQSTLNAAVTFSDPVMKESSGSVLVGSPNGAHIEIADNTITGRRLDPEEGPTDSFILGGTQNDQLVLSTGSGDVIHALYGTGDAYFSGQVSTADLVVGGENIDATLNALPKGVVAEWKYFSNWAQAGSALLGLVQVFPKVEAGRAYKLTFSGYFSGTTGDHMVMAYKIANSAGTSALTLGNTAQIDSAVFPLTRSNLNYVTFTSYYSMTTTGTRGFLVIFANHTANRPVTPNGTSNGPLTFWIEDMGPIKDAADGIPTLAGGTPYSTPPTPPTPPKKTYTKTYTSTWTRNWRGSSIQDDGTQHQGYYGGYQRVSVAGFNPGSDWTGSTLKKVELYILNKSWWGSSGTAQVSAHNYTSAPATKPGSGTVREFPSWTQGTGKWVDITSIWNVNSRAFALGINSPSSTTYYGKFDANKANIRLRVTYEK